MQQTGDMKLNSGEGIVRDFAFIWPLKKTVFDQLAWQCMHIILHIYRAGFCRTGGRDWEHNVRVAT